MNSETPIVLFAYSFPLEDAVVACNALEPFLTTYLLTSDTNEAFNKKFINPPLLANSCQIQITNTPHILGPHGDPYHFDMIEQITIFTNIGIITLNDVKVDFQGTICYPVFTNGDFNNVIDQVVIKRFSFNNYFNVLVEVICKTSSQDSDDNDNDDGNENDDNDDNENEDEGNEEEGNEEEDDDWVK